VHTTHGGSNVAETPDNLLFPLEERVVALIKVLKDNPSRDQEKRARYPSAGDKCVDRLFSSPEKKRNRGSANS
jgi:hypothetical protein